MTVHAESFKGDKAARVAIIAYGDFESPFCATFMHKTYPQIVGNYIKKRQVRFFYRDLITHLHALVAARAARCAGEQGKFWEMHDSLFANQTTLTEKDISAGALIRVSDSLPA